MRIVRILGLQEAPCPTPKLTTPGRQAIDLLGALPPPPITQAGDFGAIQVPLKGRSAAILKAR
jgi:hypothetical protein